MKMTKSCLSASILLVLSLEAALLVAGRPSDAAADHTIRLPSETQEQLVTAAPARPWECCNGAVCTKSIPPICRCTDEVEQCAPTCKSCTPSTSNPSLFVCDDQYIGDPGPICRPWDCCDLAPCTRSIPPICRCSDEVDQCAATCKDCEASTEDPSRFVCKDTYRGFPGPRCTPDGGN